jgi:nitrogen fixation NifU-like protein
MEELYREELLELYRHPRNRGKLIRPDIKTEESNPMCGDQVEIQVKLDKEGRIKEAVFDGKGCVISMASTSLLLEHVKGKTLAEIDEMTREDVLDLIGINLSPSRIKCAVLPLATLKKGIEEKNEQEKSGREKTKVKTK